MILKSTLSALVPAAIVVLGAASFLQSAEASQHSLSNATSANSIFFQSSIAMALPMAPATPPSPLLGVPGTSVMPPLPTPGAICSTEAVGGTCSTTGPGERCSAQNNNGNQCSTFGDEIASCSAAFANSACSVLPPQTVAGNPSQCSTFASRFEQRCSALATADKQQCTTKGQGFSQCSVFEPFPDNGMGTCSVFNVGAPTKSFCSTKFNMPTVAKNCSSFAPNNWCSIALGGNGRCTTFGAADPASCSAFVPGSMCSVIFDTPGIACVQ